MDPKPVLNQIFDDIRKILLANGWDRPLHLDTLENRYKINTKRDLLTDCMGYGLSVDEFIIRSVYFRLFLKFGRTYVYLAPEKIEEPLPAPTVTQNQNKRFKRKKKRKIDTTVLKFKANPWGSFEPLKNDSSSSTINGELKPRPAFDMYSDDEEDETELVEILTSENEEITVQIPAQNQVQEAVPRPLMNNNFSSNRSHQQDLVSQNSYYQLQSSSNHQQITYISAQQIDGPTMLDFQEVNNPAILGLQDLSLYERRQAELDTFSYNNLPDYWRCINSRGSQFMNS